MRLARALDITLEDLSWEHAPDDLLLVPARERSEARALAFRAREPRKGETLGRGAILAREVVGQAAEERQDAWQAAQLQAVAPSPLKRRRVH